MARAFAATVVARATTMEELVRRLTLVGKAALGFRPRPSLRRPWTWPTLSDLEPALRRLVPVLVAAFIIILAVGAAFQVREARQRALADAEGDIDLVAALVTSQMNEAIAATPTISPADLLHRALPSRALSGGRQVLLSDGTGALVGTLPAETIAARTLSERLGPAQPLTTFADKAGVMDVVLSDGRDALATVRTLRPPFGQVALVAPKSGLLADWWSSSCRSFFLLIGTTCVLLVLAAAFLWQAGRALAADAINSRVHGRIDTALDQGRCGLWDWDLARGRIYWSESMYTMLGMPSAAGYVSFGDLKGLLHLEDQCLVEVIELMAGPAGGVLDRSFRLRHAGGHWIWLRIRAVVKRETAGGGSHLVGIAIDVTDEKKRAEHIKTANERLREAVEGLSEAFVLWDAENRLVTCNSRFLKLHGLQPHLAQQGMPYSDIILRATPPSIRTSLPSPDAATSGGSTYEAQLADGRWLQVNERRTKDGGYVSVGTDITTLKRHEEQLLDSERRLMAMVADLRRSRQALETQAQQLAELAEQHAEKKAEAESANRVKSEFLANMSHELRTPLNAIIGFAEMMMGEVFGPLGSERYLAYATDIRGSGHHLLEVISDVLEMARLESGRVRLDRSLFTVNQAVDEAVLLHKAAALDKRVALLTEADPAIMIDADRPALVKVLSHLLANAVRFSPEGGTITVRVRAAGRAINLFVEDSGPGIAPAALSRIGRPFEQVDGMLLDGMKGSGLGLAIVRSIIELHGGTLRIRSAVGEGTIVMAHLPAPLTQRAPTALRTAVAA